MNTKPTKESFSSLWPTKPFQHIDEKNCQLVDVSTQIPLWKKGKHIFKVVDHTLHET
jgi:hypothetical protein